jgi:outer membrane usher protein FimD/PapC
MLLQLEINGILQGEEGRVLLRDTDGSFLLAEEDLRAFRIQLPATPRLNTGGQNYYRIADIPEAKTTLKAESQRLELVLPAEAFEQVRLQGGAAAPAAAPPPLPHGPRSAAFWTMTCWRNAAREARPKQRA